MTTVRSINLAEAEGFPPVAWDSVAALLEAGDAPAPDDINGHTTWLTTINADGSPHVSPLGAIWVDGTFWFQTGRGTRKARNLGRDPRCSVATSVRGGDVVFEGDAVHVTDRDALTRVIKAWADGGWPAEVDESGTGITAPYNAPTLGPPPWQVYRVEPRSAVAALGDEPGGLARFTF